MLLCFAIAIATAAAFAGASAHAALVGEARPTAEAVSCQGGLQFGMMASRIPFACDAHPVESRTTPTGRQEKWRYNGGYLFFLDGVLTAIRQIAR